MKAVLLAKDASTGLPKAELKEVDTPIPGPGGLVVKLEACGLCGTDIEKIRGEYTAAMPVLGHEAVGTIAAVGEGVAGFREGDRVFPHHHVPCHSCHYCKAGSETMCDMYRSSNLTPGGFSEFFRVPRWNVSKGGVLKLPDDLNFDVASLVEPVACCVRALDKCGVKSGESVLVAGAGPVGMMHSMLLKSMGADVIVSDVSEGRLEFAERSGVRLVINAAKVDVPNSVKAETEGRGSDVVIVASGSPEAIIQGLRSVRKGGRICLFGIPSRGSILDYDIGDLYNSELSVFASYGATETETKRAMAQITSNHSDFAKLLTHKFPLEMFDEAVDTAASGRGMKIVVTPD
ncbi:MAG: zinc-dependent dehydrogenase [Thaumarchaeota archaeon]|nr:zinc-dependent dehydrogenase [Nitrososphaerota archaeon]